MKECFSFVIPESEFWDYTYRKIEEEIRSRANNDICEYIENRIKENLDKRPRYSKRIPEKIYMKFHTIERKEWEIKFSREWKWYKITQDCEFSLKFK